MKSLVATIHAKRAAEKAKRKAERSDLEAVLDRVKVVEPPSSPIWDWCQRKSIEFLSTPDVEAILIGIGCRGISIQCWPQTFHAASCVLGTCDADPEPLHLTAHARKILAKRLVDTWLDQDAYMEVLRGRPFGDRVIFDENWVARGHTHISFSTDKLDTQHTNWLYVRVPDDDV